MLLRLRRGLLAVTVFSLVFALCPCLVCADMPEDDCCASDGPSISGVCCAEDGSPKTAVPSATVFIPANAVAAVQTIAVDTAVGVSFHAYVIPDRPIVARAVLRI